MARKADVKGGNGDVVFNAETGTARKYLRNTSTAEKVICHTSYTIRKLATQRKLVVCLFVASCVTACT